MGAGCSSSSNTAEFDSAVEAKQNLDTATGSPTPPDPVMTSDQHSSLTQQQKHIKVSQENDGSDASDGSSSNCMTSAENSDFSDSSGASTHIHRRRRKFVSIVNRGGVDQSCLDTNATASFHGPLSPLKDSSGPMYQVPSFTTASNNNNATTVPAFDLISTTDNSTATDDMVSCMLRSGSTCIYNSQNDRPSTVDTREGYKLPGRLARRASQEEVPHTMSGSQKLSHQQEEAEELILFNQHQPQEPRDTVDVQQNTQQSQLLVLDDVPHIESPATSIAPSRGHSFRLAELQSGDSHPMRGAICPDHATPLNRTNNNSSEHLKMDFPSITTTPAAGTDDHPIGCFQPSRKPSQSLLSTVGASSANSTSFVSHSHGGHLPQSHSEQSL